MTGYRSVALLVALFGAALIDRAAAETPTLSVQTGHSKPVMSVAISPDGRWLASGGLDNTVRLWDLETGKELRSLTAPEISDHARGVHGLDFHPERQQLATSLFSSVLLWNSESGELLDRWELEDSVTDLAYDRGGGRLAITDVKGRLHVRDLATGRSRSSSATPRGTLALSWSPDGQRIATGGFDRVIRLWDSRSLEQVDQLLGHDDTIETVAFGPNGLRLASGGRDEEITVWDLASGETLWSRVARGHVLSVTYSPEGVLAAGGRYGDILLLDSESGELWQAVTVEAWVQQVAFGPRGDVLVGGGWDNSIRVWEAESGLETHALKGQAVEPAGLDVSRDGKRLAVAGTDGSLVIWDLESGRRRRPLAARLGRWGAVRFHPDGRLLATAGDDGVRLWSLDEPTEPPREIRPPQRSDERGRVTRNLAWSSDGALLAIADQAEVVVWNLASGRFEHGFEAPALPADEETPKFTDVAFSPDADRLATGTSSNLVIWNLATGEMSRPLLEPREQQALRSFSRSIRHLTWSSDGRRLAAARVDTIFVWDAEDGSRLHELSGHINNIWSLRFEPQGNRLASGGAYGPIRLWDAEAGTQLAVLSDHTFAVEAVGWGPEGRFLVSGSADGRANLWATRNGDEARRIATLVSFQDDSWAAVDRDGRYDASDGGDVPWLHWVVGSEPIELAQLKERYYEPALLAKHLGWNDEPLRNVAAFDRVDLFPSVAVKTPEPGESRLRISLQNRGGGIGRVVVRINGKEIASDARGESADPNAGQLDLALDMAGHPYLVAGAENTVEVVAYNADGYLASRGVRAVYRPPGEAENKPPTLWAILAGVSDYPGKNLDLRYAAKDANDVATAIGLAAERLFGSERIRLEVLTTDQEGAGLPTRENLGRAFENARAARPTDILLVYLAGHGVVHGGEDGDFYYLTRDAATADLTDPAVRLATAISSTELTQWIKAVPALKQVMILDTCAAGGFVDTLSEKRDVPSSQIRSLERMKDRTGLYVLAGSAANAVSYETSRYGQGLLTWSLLFGMRGGALREGQFVDVSSLFDFAADRVPDLAREIGGIQRPVVAAPRGGASFDIGRLAPDDRDRIPLAIVRPMVVRSRFQEELSFDDLLRIGGQADEALRAGMAAGTGAPVFVDAREFGGAYYLAGRYSLDGDRVKVTVRVLRDAAPVGSLEIDGSKEEIDGLVADIVAQAAVLIASHHESL